MTIPVPAPSTSRIAIFDGLRGFAIILVVLSHGWTLWPTDRIAEIAFVDPWFQAGDLAVSIFFVIGSFLVTRALLRSAASPDGLRPSIATARRVLRLGGQMWGLLLVVLLVAALDSTDTYPQTSTRESVVRSASFTWNWYVHSHAWEARPDLGHLWYVSVDLQMFLVILLAVWLLRRRPAWLLAALAAAWVVLVFWRTDIFHYDPFGAMVRTSARGDAPLAGAVAAAALPFVKRLVRWAPAAAVMTTIALLPLTYVNADAATYMGWGGVILDIVLAVFVVATTLAAPPRLLTTVVGTRAMAFLGRHSLSVYLWHYPMFWFISRHTVDWHWFPKVLVAFALAALAALLSERLVENRVQRLLDSPAWSGTARAILADRWHAVRGRPERRTAGSGAGSEPSV